MTTRLGDPSGRASLDVARGVLIALTGCSEAEAFTAVTQAAHDHDIPVFTLAAALIATAQRRGDTTGLEEYLATAITTTWGSLWPDHVTATGSTP